MSGRSGVEWEGKINDLQDFNEVDKTLQERARKGEMRIIISSKWQ
jgi:hypothetical protein